MEELFFISDKQLSTVRAKDWDLLPFFFTFVAAKLTGADSTANRAFVLISDSLMFCGKSFGLQYLVNALSRDTNLSSYF